MGNGLRRARRPHRGGRRGLLSGARLVLRALLGGDAVPGAALVGASSGSSPRTAGSVRVRGRGGLLWGTAILARETPCISFRSRRCGSPGAAAARRPRGRAFLAAALAVVAPWTWRNWVAFGAFVPVSTAGALNLYQGNAPLSRQEVYDQYGRCTARIEKYHSPGEGLPGHPRAPALVALREAPRRRCRTSGKRTARPSCTSCAAVTAPSRAGGGGRRRDRAGSLLRGAPLFAVGGSRCFRERGPLACSSRSSPTTC